MKRTILCLILATGSMFAGVTDVKLDDGAPMAAGSHRIAVYFSQHGKTYHTHRDCGTLRRSKTVLTAAEHDAQVHGLTLCSICAHRHHAGVVDGKNSSWATEVK